MIFPSIYPDIDKPDPLDSFTTPTKSVHESYVRSLGQRTALTESQLSLETNPTYYPQCKLTSWSFVQGLDSPQQRTQYPILENALRDTVKVQSTGGPVGQTDKILSSE